MTESTASSSQYGHYESKLARFIQLTENANSAQRVLRKVLYTQT